MADSAIKMDISDLPRGNRRQYVGTYHPPNTIYKGSRVIASNNTASIGKHIDPLAPQQEVTRDVLLSGMFQGILRVSSNSNSVKEEKLRKKQEDNSENPSDRVIHRARKAEEAKASNAIKAVKVAEARASHEAKQNHQNELTAEMANGLTLAQLHEHLEDMGQLAPSFYSLDPEVDQPVLHKKRMNSLPRAVYANNARKVKYQWLQVPRCTELPGGKQLVHTAWVMQPMSNQLARAAGLWTSSRRNKGAQQKVIKILLKEQKATIKVKRKVSAKQLATPMPVATEQPSTPLHDVFSTHTSAYKAPATDRVTRPGAEPRSMSVEKATKQSLMPNARVEDLQRQINAKEIDISYVADAHSAAVQDMEERRMELHFYADQIFEAQCELEDLRNQLSEAVHNTIPFEEPFVATPELPRSIMANFAVLPSANDVRIIDIKSLASKAIMDAAIERFSEGPSAAEPMLFVGPLQQEVKAVIKTHVELEERIEERIDAMVRDKSYRKDRYIDKYADEAIRDTVNTKALMKYGFKRCTDTRMQQTGAPMYRSVVHRPELNTCERLVYPKQTGMAYKRLIFPTQSQAMLHAAEGYTFDLWRSTCTVQQDPQSLGSRKDGYIHPTKKVLENADIGMPVNMASVTVGYEDGSLISYNGMPFDVDDVVTDLLGAKYMLEIGRSLYNAHREYEDKRLSDLRSPEYAPLQRVNALTDDQQGQYSSFLSIRAADQDIYDMTNEEYMEEAADILQQYDEATPTELTLMRKHQEDMDEKRYDLFQRGIMTNRSDTSLYYKVSPPLRIQKAVRRATVKVRFAGYLDLERGIEQYAARRVEAKQKLKDKIDDSYAEFEIEVERVPAEVKPSLSLVVSNPLKQVAAVKPKSKQTDVKPASQPADIPAAALAVISDKLSDVLATLQDFSVVTPETLELLAIQKELEALLQGKTK